MARIDDLLPTLYRDMHAQGAFPGTTWTAHRAAAEAFFRPDSFPVLDFGCGPLGGLRAAYGDRVVPYDPYVPEFAADPWVRRPRGFFTSDVLEHLPVHALRALVLRIAAAPYVRQVFAAVSTRAANKIMPNGLNAHLTVRHGQWWRGFFDCALGEWFDPVGADYDMLDESCTFRLNRRDPEAA